MNQYDEIEDPLCYSGTHVLRNKAGLRDQELLDEFEHTMYVSRSREPLPKGALDYEYYKRIHHHLFQDVYDWAGQPREIRTGKGGVWFCYPEYIDTEMNKLFTQLAAEAELTGISDANEFAGRAAHYIAEVNAVHPFREGNGRCQMTLLAILLKMSGFDVPKNHIEPESFMQAMIASFQGNNEPLTQAILRIMA